nr:MAG TPA: hypothetical protein [Caudoviricetes sp.]
MGLSDFWRKIKAAFLPLQKVVTSGNNIVTSGNNSVTSGNNFLFFFCPIPNFAFYLDYGKNKRRCSY